jgi:hypothetical protein
LPAGDGGCERRQLSHGRNAGWCGEDTRWDRSRHVRRDNEHDDRRDVLLAG